MRAAHLALAAAAAVLLCAPAAASAAVLGIDVSRFEQHIGWNRVAADGIRFAYVQASRGSGSDCIVKPQTCGPDGFYAINHRRARQAGIRVGAYHRAFAGGGSLRGARADARREAEVFVASVGSLQRNDLLPALDFETPFGGLSPRELRAWVTTWVRRVRNELGAEPMIYTNVTSWALTGNTRQFARAGNALWVANWGVAHPAVPAHGWDGRGWAVWQYANDGHVPGIRGRVDLDRLGTPFRSITVPAATPRRTLVPPSCGASAPWPRPERSGRRPPAPCS
jgi:lysozyme